MTTTDPSVTLAKALKSLEGIDPTLVSEGTPPELARRLDLLYRLSSATRLLQEEIVESLSSSMEDDSMVIAGVGNVVRKPKFSSTWIDDSSRERMFDDAIRAIIRKVAIDPMTGEVHPALSNAIRETFNLLDSSFSFGADPKTGFRKNLGLQPDEYRSKRRTGFSIGIEEVGV
jgi:hypothetical protein